MLSKSRSIITSKISLSKLTFEMCRYHIISPKNKANKEEWAGGLGRRGSENISKGMELPRNPHKIGGLGTCMLLMNY